MCFTVYILYSTVFEKIYVGCTSNLIERFKSHNFLSSKGYTVKYRPWIVIYCEYFNEKTAAIKKEKFLKSGKGRMWIHAKISKELEAQGFLSA